MDAWWRIEPLDAFRDQLVDAVLEAHYKSSFRSNPSSVTVAQVADSSGELSKAISAGILTMGGKHAPLEATYRFLSLEEPAREVPRILKFGQKVPGWGGTFQKDQPDPIWQDVRVMLSVTKMGKKIDSVSAELMRHGKHIHPNPSAYTAAAAFLVDLPANLAAYLFIAGRLKAWVQIAAEQLRKAA